MPLYLVRWPGLEASLVKAEDERELLLYLDDVGDPSDCRWWEYDGPLWVDFDLDVYRRVETESGGFSMVIREIDSERVKEFAEEFAPMSLSIGDGAAGDEMRDAILNEAFPALARAIEDWDETETDRPDPELVEAALRQDMGLPPNLRVVPPELGEEL